MRGFSKFVAYTLDLKDDPTLAYNVLWFSNIRHSHLESLVSSPVSYFISMSY